MHNARLTVLGAVNKMLQSVMEAPVASLDAGLSDAATAADILHGSSRKIQARGWGCNSVRGEVFTKLAGTDQFRVPENILKLKTGGQHQHIQVNVKKLGDHFHLWDRSNRTFDFPSVDRLICNVVYFMPFDELTPILQQYVFTDAAHRFQKGFAGSPLLWEFTAENVAEAQMLAEAEEADTEHYNVLKMSRDPFLGTYRNNWFWG